MEDSSSDSAGAGHEITAEDYRRLHPQLYAQIRRLGIAPAEVEDLMQETFLHAQRALERGQFEARSSLDTWIVSIAKNRVLKYRRSRVADKRRAVLMPLEETEEAASAAVRAPLSPEADPQERAANRQLLGRATRALKRLPEDFRAPLVLSVCGHTYEQIASLLRIPSSLVTSRIHQARAKLRKALSETGREAGG